MMRYRRAYLCEARRAFQAETAAMVQQQSTDVVRASATIADRVGLRDPVWRLHTWPITT
jgi:hypothetical protein